MTDHWRRSTFLVLTLIALTACGEVVSQAELVQATAPVLETALPTPTPEPSATPRPTETATLAPTPQPSPTPQEPTLTPTPDIPLGQVRENPETGAIEVWVGEWAKPPLADGFDPTHLVIEDAQVHYRSDGLTQVWSSEARSWVFPETFYWELGKVVPASLMGGRIEIADQAAAWQAHQDMVLAWLNNQANKDFLDSVYGKEVITFDDLAVRDSTGEIIAYEIKLTDVNGAKVWPRMLGVGSYGDVNFNSLGDTLDNPDATQKIDVSSPIWLYSGWKEWAKSDGAFFESATDGPNSQVGSGWAAYGLRFTDDGRLVYFSGSKENFKSKYPDIALIGGISGDEVKPSLAGVYLGSVIKAYAESYPGMTEAISIPYTADPTVPNWIRLGLEAGDEAEYGYAGLFE